MSHPLHAVISRKLKSENINAQQHTNISPIRSNKPKILFSPSAV